MRHIAHARQPQQPCQGATGNRGLYGGTAKRPSDIVKNFREEAGMIKFYGFVGEIPIHKDQIQAIRPAGEPTRPLETLSRPELASTEPARVPTTEEKQSSPQETG